MTIDRANLAVSPSVSATAGASAPAAKPSAAPSALAAPDVAAFSARPAVAPAAPKAAEGGFHPIKAIKGWLTAAGKWALSPYLNYAAKMGADAFILPNHASGTDPATPESAGMKGEALSFKAKDGTPLKGYWIPAEPKSDKTVVLAHGHGGAMGDMIGPYAKWLHKAGYNVVTFDFRNHAASGGKQTTMGFEERQDLEAAIDQASARAGDRIAVLGVSMGGATALTEAVDDPRVKAIVSDCAFDTLHNAIETRAKNTTIDIGPFKGVHLPFINWVTEAVIDRVQKVTGHTEASPGGALRDVEPIDTIGELDRPVFLIHGSADNGTPPVTSRNLAKADPDAELWMVPGAGHAESRKTAGKEYETRVLDFLGRSF